jgi:FAD/FMN-containing dehydrogenase
MVARAAASSARIKDRDLANFAKSLEGGIYLPNSTEYERLRRAFAAKVNLYPALIVRAVNTEDVSRAVVFARTHSLPLAVRCGGHSYAGYNSCNDGLIIDLSGLRNVTITPEASTVRVGGGVLTRVHIRCHY